MCIDQELNSNLSVHRMIDAQPTKPLQLGNTLVVFIERNQGSEMLFSFGLDFDAYCKKPQSNSDLHSIEEDFSHI